MKYTVIFAIFFLVLNAQAIAKDKSEVESITLSDVLSAYSVNSKSKVIASDDVDGGVQLLGLDLKDIDYELFLAILKVKGLTAYKTENYTVIIPDHQARIHVTEKLDAGSEYAPDQYVTEIITVKNMCVASLMPILKPIVHLHSFLEPTSSSNSIVVVDSYRNVVRLKDIISRLDSLVDKPQKCENQEKKRAQKASEKGS